MAKLRHISDLLPPDLDSLVKDEDLNDSNKSWQVATDMWAIHAIRVELAATATVGNRQVVVRIVDASNDSYFECKAGAVQAASTTYDYYFAAGLPRETSVVANTLLAPIPSILWLPATWKLWILDSAAVDAAADDMKVYALGASHPLSA